MAPMPVTEDYYLVLNVEQSATTETITKSFRALALLLHPDRNKKADATEAFQLLGKAYETLKDSSARRAYDQLYPQIKSKSSTSQTKPSPKQEDGDIAQETAVIAALLKAKAERATKWAKSRKVYDDAIFELKREVRKVQAALEELDDKDKEEDAQEAARKGWTTWILSPLYGKPVETEEEKERKGRERIERMHSRGFKERELERKDKELRRWEVRLGDEEEEFVRKERSFDAERAVLEERIRMKRETEKRERERKEAEAREQALRVKLEKEKMEREARQRAWREQLAKEMREMEAREKAAKEAREKEAREKAAREVRQRESNLRYMMETAQQRKQEYEAATSRARQWTEDRTSSVFDRSRKDNRVNPIREQDGPLRPAQGLAPASRTTCLHEGWWDKIEGRRACESCAVSRYSYLLQCPSCKMKACASCQQQLRPPRRNVRRMQADQARHHTSGRTSFGPGSTYDDDDSYDYSYVYD